MTTAQQHTELNAAFVEEFVEFHIDVLRRILRGSSLDEIEADAPEEFRRFQYREFTKHSSLLSFDEAGELRGAYPVSPRPTGIRMQVEGVGTGFAMCAIDALGAAFLFGARTTVTAADPTTDREVSITIDPESPDLSAYEDMHVTVPRAMPEKCADEAFDSAVDFCPLIGFVENRDTIPSEQEGLVTTIPFRAAFEYGKSTFNKGAFVSQARATLGAMALLSAKGDASAKEMTDVFLKDNINPSIKQMPEDQARRIVVNTLRSRGLIDERTVADRVVYRLTAIGEQMLRPFVSREAE